MSSTIPIFTLTSGRSGTLYLKDLFQNNGFGRAIYDAEIGRHDRVRKLLARKRAYIRRLGAPFYLE